MVDDEQDLRAILRKVFELKGWSVFEAASGNEGDSFLQKTPVDIVITDVRMADGDGIDLLKAIRRRDSKVPPVIVTTGFTDITEKEIMALGAIAFLPKPFDLNLMYKMVDSFVPQS